MPRRPAHPLSAPALLALLALLGCDPGPVPVDCPLGDAHEHDENVDLDPFGLDQVSAASTLCDPQMSVFPVDGAHNIGYDHASCGSGTCAISCPDVNANSDWGGRHHGIDIFAWQRAPLVAVADGQVVATGVVSATSGERVRIRDACGWEYYYGHLDEIVVSSGEWVSAGQLIGYMGYTGAASTHLHFNVSPWGAYSSDINPFALLDSTSPTACIDTPPPDSDGDGSIDDEDCADWDPARHPGAPEVCNGLDDDCDWAVDEGLTTDSDGDGHSSPGSCGGSRDDCDDSRAGVHPGHTESCDGLDNDCDGSTDEGLSTDADGDGVSAPGSCSGGANDCHDGDASVAPGLPEACDGRDNDCDGRVDEDLYLDADGDDRSAPGSCGGTRNDCDDSDPARYPGHLEICDGIDNDCDSQVDEGLAEDADADGFAAPGSCGGDADDCDDFDPSSHPGAPELCDARDNDCDGAVDEDLTVDADGDGHSDPASCGGSRDDCDDDDPRVHPGAAELCDGRDSDCDGLPGSAEVDADGDGYTGCMGDCDDRRGAAFPGAPELCNGYDDDCDGLPGQDELDEDDDGWTVCGGDCDDLADAVHPEAPERCDGRDSDCDGLMPTDERDNDGDGALDCDRPGALFAGGGPLHPLEQEPDGWSPPPYTAGCQQGPGTDGAPRPMWLLGAWIGLLLARPGRRAAVCPDGDNEGSD